MSETPPWKLPQEESQRADPPFRCARCGKGLDGAFQVEGEDRCNTCTPPSDAEIERWNGGTMTAVNRTAIAERALKILDNISYTGCSRDESISLARAYAHVGSLLPMEGYLDEDELEDLDPMYGSDPEPVRDALIRQRDIEDSLMRQKDSEDTPGWG